MRLAAMRPAVRSAAVKDMYEKHVSIHIVMPPAAETLTAPFSSIPKGRILLDALTWS